MCRLFLIYFSKSQIISKCDKRVAIALVLKLKITINSSSQRSSLQHMLKLMPLEDALGLVIYCNAYQCSGKSTYKIGIRQ